MTGTATTTSVAPARRRKAVFWEDFLEEKISDEEFTLGKQKYIDSQSKDVPKNKEELFYRVIFDRLFPNREQQNK